MNLLVGKGYRAKDVALIDVAHCSRVAEYSYLTAKLLGLNKELCNDILQAGQYHDVGKAFLDRSILNKPGPLTKEEMEHVKYHVIFSAAVAIEQQFNNNVIRAIYMHHENFDGSGYPSGLKDRDIPIGARILRIADFYDALTSDRVYRDKYSRDNAIKIMEDNIKLLDPDVLNIFLKNLSSNANVQQIKINKLVLDSGTQEVRL